MRLLVHCYLCCTNPRRWHNNLNKSSRYVIDEAGNEPLGRKCANRTQQSDIDSNRCSGIHYCFSLELPFFYFKITG